MATDIIGATDAVLGAIAAYWTANAGVIVGGSPPTLLFEANERDLKPHPADSVDPWARAVVRHGTSPPAPIRGQFPKLFWRTGIAFIQIFVPNKDATSYTVAQGLANVARRAYEGKRMGMGDSVVFERVDIREQGIDGAWYRADVIGHFRFSELSTG